MKILARSLFAWLVTGLGIALYVAGQGIRFGPAPSQDLFFVLMPLAALLVGGLIAIRLPRSIYGWLWILLGWGWGVLQPWGIFLAQQALTASTPRVWLASIGVEIAEVGWYVSTAMVSLTILLYPTGRPPSPRWRILVWIVALAILLSTISTWAAPGIEGEGITGREHPLALEDPIGQIASTITSICILIFFTSILLATLSLVFRYRQASGQERVQLHWLAYAAVLNIAFFIVDNPSVQPAWASETAMTLISNALLLILPLAVAIAILRYRLYDIDLIIRKTLAYASLTLTLGLVFFGGVALLQGLVGRLTGTEDSPVIIVISTLAIAALFSPLRRRIQDFIDRRFYRQKYNAELALESFAETARSETDLEALTGKLVEVVNQTMQPTQVSLWVKPTSERKPKPMSGNNRRSAVGDPLAGVGR